MPEALKIGFILFSILANFLLGIIVLSKNSKNIVNINLALFAWVFSVWSLTLLLYDYPVIFSSLFWIKATYLVVVFGIVNCLFNFSFIFPTGKEKPPFLGTLAFLIPAVFFGYSIIFTDLFVGDVVRQSWGYSTILGPAYIPFNLWAIFFSSWGFMVLIKKYRKAQGYIKAQLKYMFLGLALFVTSVVILDSIFPIVTGASNFFSISTTTSLFFVIFTSYAMIKHRLLDIRVALQEVSVFLLTSSIISLLLSLGAILYWSLTAQEFKLGVIFLILMLSSLLTLIFEKISFLAKMLAKNFFGQSVYDYQKEIRDLSLNLSSSLDLQKLIEILVEKLTETFKLKKVAILLYDHGKNRYLLQKVVGLNKTQEQIEEIFNSFTQVYFPEPPRIIDLEEIRKLASGPVFGFKENSLRQLASIMDQNELALIIPLITNNKIIGIVVIGEKASLDPYTVQDINFLNTMAFETSIAFQNAKSYDEIQKFNITLTKEVEDATRELKGANEKLQVLDKLKDDFVSIASHELRTPMTAIRSYAWMALHRSDVPISDKLKRYLIRVLISTERLINLVNDMLNISRIESGRIEINPSPIDCLSLIKDIVDEVYYSKSTEKKFQFEILEKKMPKIFADPEKLRQVLLNLVGNSIKFTPQDGKITFDFFTDGKTVEISIKDTGVGISKEDLSKLFHKFSRLDNSYTAISISGGTGLGLYISKNLIELMHGKIWAQSEGVGRGTTVTVSLPVASPEVLTHADQFTIKPKGEVKGLEPVAI